MRAALVGLLLALSGCVSIVRDLDGEVLVSSVPAGALATYGGQEVITPGVLYLPRDHAGQICIRKDGYQTVHVNFNARADAGYWVLSIFLNALHGYFTLGISFALGLLIDYHSGVLNSFDGDVMVYLVEEVPEEPATDPVWPEFRPTTPPEAEPPPTRAPPVAAVPSVGGTPEPALEPKDARLGPVGSLSTSPRPDPLPVGSSRAERLARELLGDRDEPGDFEHYRRTVRWLEFAERRGGAELEDAVLASFAITVWNDESGDEAALEAEWDRLCRASQP